MNTTTTTPPPQAKLEPIQFTRINNTANGAPRLVCHFLNLFTAYELHNPASPYSNMSITEKYNIALDRAKKISGKKYHNKQYGGGIAFTTYESESQLQNTIYKHIGLIQKDHSEACMCANCVKYNPDRTCWACKGIKQGKLRDQVCNVCDQPIK